MSLAIETFSNVAGGNAFYKAISHPLAAAKAIVLLELLAGARQVAVYDPAGLADAFAVLYDLGRLPITAVYVQDIGHIGAMRLGREAQPVSDLRSSGADVVLIAAFDAERSAAHVAALVPDGARIETLDRLRLDDIMLSNPAHYLDPLNFATNFALFRDAGGEHTRIVTTNYWTRYGAGSVRLWLALFGGDGTLLACWTETLPPGAPVVVIDSAEVRARFGLPDFIGQLMIHAVGARGHDVVKYALDIWSDDGRTLSCSHDANAWPADLYAGLPAPRRGERIVLWVQNSHPAPIPAGAIGLNLMGTDRVATVDEEIGPFATRGIDVAEFLPDAAWPRQIEVRAGRHFVRPRYEVLNGGGRRIAHANVERVDLDCDPRLPELGNLMGKGYILPAPILPPERWSTVVLPTPMATCQRELPIAALMVDASGREVARHRFGRLARHHGTALDLTPLIEAAGGLPGGFGHVELIYDFAEGGEADGWLHAVFRYQERSSGHVAETSFGAHMFNTVLTYRGEPQSYSSRPPGLTTRLFLRLGRAPLDTLCQLIYPASTPWRATSRTVLVLRDGAGAEVARRRVDIPCGGSHLWRYGETFAAAERRRAGDGAYVVVRDRTCRLFGYHGLVDGKGRFSLDHMFGF